MGTFIYCGIFTRRESRRRVSGRSGGIASNTSDVCRAEPKVVVLFDWAPPLVPSTSVPRIQMRWWMVQVRSEKLVLNFHAEESPFIPSWFLRRIQLPEIVIVLHGSVPRKAPGSASHSFKTLHDTLDSLLRTTEEARREHLARIEANHSWYRAEEAKVTFVNCEVLPFPPPTQSYFEIRYLTLRVPRGGGRPAVPPRDRRRVCASGAAQATPSRGHGR